MPKFAILPERKTQGPALNQRHSTKRTDQAVSYARAITYVVVRDRGGAITRFFNSQGIKFPHIGIGVFCIICAVNKNSYLALWCIAIAFIKSSPYSGGVCFLVRKSASLIVAMSCKCLACGDHFRVGGELQVGIEMRFG